MFFIHGTFFGSGHVLEPQRLALASSGIPLSQTSTAFFGEGFLAEVGSEAIPVIITFTIAIPIITGWRTIARLSALHGQLALACERNAGAALAHFFGR